MREKLAVVILAVLALTGFSPPQRPPLEAQQVVPKSWIPEKPPEQDAPKPPDITLNVTPKTPSAYRHPEGGVCSLAGNGEPMKVKKEFVESYVQAKAAVDAGRYEDAIALAELAAGHSYDARQWTAIEGIRIVAFSRLNNDAELVAALEAALSLAGCIPQAQVSNYQELLEGARERLKNPSPQ